MRNQRAVWVLAMAALALSAVAVMRGPQGAAAAKETSYARVMRTKTLRCGYELWPGGVMQKPDGTIYGPIPEMMAELGKVADLKVVYTEHVGWGDVAAALKSGKVDAICAGMWQSSVKAKELTFSPPLAYQGLEAFARADDHRFDGDVKKINDPAVTIMAVDADNSDFIAKQDFPRAKELTLSQLNGTDDELFMGVMGKKGDVTFSSVGGWRQFDKSNPGKLKRVAPGVDLRVFGLSIATDNDDPRWLSFLNVAVAEIVNSGAVARVTAKYAADYPDMYLPVAKPYEVVK